MSESARFQHTPYDGSSRPFTVGLKPISDELWLEPDTFLIEHLSQKKHLFATSRDTVFRIQNDTLAASEEVLQLILENLTQFHKKSHLVLDDYVELVETEEKISLLNPLPFLLASSLVQEDMVLMRSSENGYYLAAASVCFPSSWSLSDKFGQSMSGLHKNVPGFNGQRMGNMVSRIFENLSDDQTLLRFNWSIYPDGELHHPLPKQIHFKIDEGALASLFLRVERQTLRRLPQTRDILFTVKIHHDPLSVLAEQENAKEIATGLVAQLLALDEEQLVYKGLKDTRAPLIDMLKSFE